MNYLDLGFTKFLTKSIFPQRSSSLQNSSSFSPGSFSNQILGADAVTNEKTKYNYRAFNAVVDVSGNGDFKDIQPAIEFVNKNGGGLIFIKSGDYYLDSDITLYSNISLIGEDNNSTVINFSVQSYSINSVGSSGDHLRNIFIKNIKIQQSTDTNSGCVNFTFTDNIEISNCIFAGNYNSGDGFGIDCVFTSCSRVRFTDNYSINSDQCPQLINSKIILVERNYINYSNTIGMYLRGCSDATIHANTIENCLGSGIEIDNCENIRCSNNYISNYVLTGIKIVNSNGSISRSSFVGNVIRSGANATSDAIVISSSNYLIFNANVIYDPQDIGIRLLNGDNIIINGNIIDSAVTGISINATSDRNIVTGNMIYNDTTAISDSGSNTVKANNIIA